MSAYEGVQKLAPRAEPREQGCIASAHRVALFNRTGLRAIVTQPLEQPTGTKLFMRTRLKRAIFET